MQPITDFLKMESAGGILLMIAAVLAIICANTPLDTWYALFLSVPVSVQVGSLEVAKPLLLWINDGLMALFFLLVGLELKREMVEGELSSWENIVLPGVGAIGGMAVPALVYLAFNAGNPAAMQGWAIPAATDIAFALGVLSLLGSRVPISVKVFLTSLAIFDDIGAIVIIALFYTANISIQALAVVGFCIPVLYLMNRMKVEKRSIYLMVGLVMWVATLKSGVHATLSTVILAMFIPLKSESDPDFSPLKSLEHDLHGLVAFFILPVFAFANAGLDFRGSGLDTLTHPVPMGIAAGLFAGKQLGIFLLCALCIRCGLTTLPPGMNWRTLYGTAALCGIGFTMSLFIGSLAFQETGVDQFFDERLGIILGSVLSGVLGFLILRSSLEPEKKT